MEFQKPIAEQLPNLQNAQQSIQNTAADMASSVSNVQASIANTMNEFSSKSAVDASQEFLDSNSIIAKFVFIILVLIVFMFLFNLGVMLIGYFTKPSNNPYLVNGLIDGNMSLVIPQDPKNGTAVTLPRSNNENTGIEMTWSTWIQINDNNNTKYTYQNIFNKGAGTYDNTTGIASINGPGLYLKTGSGNDGNTLHVVMDTVKNNQSIDVTNIPMNKWVHVALRLENTVLDVYINGTISGRMVFTSVPKQNYYDVNVCGNAGFSGKQSNLRYYDHALSAFEINNIVAAGPNTETSSKSSITGGKDAYYLSSQWFASKL